MSGSVLCVPWAAAYPPIGLIIVARYMPRRTEKGADAVARWRAFKRYLQNLEKYTKVEEATGIFERYLPYAVAFGLEQSFIRKFSPVDAPPPTWWIPYGYPRPYYGGGWAGVGRRWPCRRVMRPPCRARAAVRALAGRHVAGAWAPRWPA